MEDGDGEMRIGKLTRNKVLGTYLLIVPTFKARSRPVVLHMPLCAKASYVYHSIAAGVGPDRVSPTDRYARKQNTLKFLLSYQYYLRYMYLSHVLTYDIVTGCIFSTD